MVKDLIKINRHPEREKIEAFGRSILFAFTTGAFIYLLLGGSSDSFSNAIIFSTGIFVTGILLYIASRMDTLVAEIFYRITYPLWSFIRIVAQNAILSILYFSVFYPFSFILTALTLENSLLLRKDSNKKSWWNSKL